MSGLLKRAVHVIGTSSGVIGGSAFVLVALSLACSFASYARTPREQSMLDRRTFEKLLHQRHPSHPMPSIDPDRA